MGKNNTTKEKSISEKMQELERLTEWFYTDEFELDKAASRYEEAIKLSQEIEADLENLKNKIEVIEKDFTKD